MVQTALEKAKNFFERNKREVVILLLILLLGSVLRLYRLPEYMTFLGDEGRDVIIVRRFLVHGDIFLIGPGTSIGNMYLGPLYYYFMAPWLFLSGLSPVGPAIAIALLGVVTIWFIWHVTREWFDNGWGALIAAFLYAIAPTVIIYSRSSWNPNIMPFFSLLCVYSAWKALKTNNFRWLVLLSISFAFVLQSHYLGLALAPTLALVWLWGVFMYRKTGKLGSYLKYTFNSIVLFLALMSPLLIFDFRHGWINFNAMKVFFTERQTTVSARPWSSLPELWPLLQEISTRLVSGRNMMLGSWTALFTILGSIWVAKKRFRGKRLINYTILVIWLGFALLGLGVYKQNIYDHYYGFFFVVPFIMIGAISGELIAKAKIRGTWLVLTGLVFLTYYNFLDTPVRYQPNRQLQRSVEVAEKIQTEAGGEKFNLAVIAERNYEDAYQYFLEWWQTGVTDIDPQLSEETITEQLFVVCELPRDECDPTHNEKAGIANFGWSKIEQEWNISGVTLFKLVHTEN